jgi:hypothetical protein
MFYFFCFVHLLLSVFLGLLPTVGGKASKGLRAIPSQATRKVGAGYKLSHTTETLIGYTAC